MSSEMSVEAAMYFCRSTHALILQGGMLLRPIRQYLTAVAYSPKLRTITLWNLRTQTLANEFPSIDEGA